MKFIAALILMILPPGEWKTFDAPEYSITYPDTWQLNQSGLAGTKFILFDSKSQSPVFRDNLNLIVQDLKGQNIDLSKFVEISTTQLKQFITNLNISYSQTKGSGVDQKHKIIYSGNQGQLNLTWQQYYLVRNEKVFVLTFTATQDTFTSQIETASKVMDSFTIK
jgi:hypothetical protein